MRFETDQDIQGLNISVELNVFCAEILPAGSYICEIEQIEIVPDFKVKFLTAPINGHRWGCSIETIKKMFPGYLFD